MAADTDSVIELHPKMVNMWVNRCKEVRKTKGLLAAKAFATKMFTSDQIKEINKAVNKAAKEGNKDEGRT